MGDNKGIRQKFEPTIEVLEPDLSIHDTEIHFNIAVGPKAGLNLGLPMGKLGIGLGAKFDIVRIDNRLAEYKSKQYLEDSRSFSFREADRFRTDVTSACTAPKEKEEVFENALGYTMDVKTGFYAFFNLAGIYIDTSWLGDITGDGFSGLYWGVKSLIAKCGDCGNRSCLSQAADEVLGVAKDGFESLLAPGFKDMGGSKKAAVTDLTDSEHEDKGSIDSLDKSILGMDMPTGNPNASCYAKSADSRQRFARRQWESMSRISRRNFMHHDKPNPCQQ